MYMYSFPKFPVYLSGFRLYSMSVYYYFEVRYHQNVWIVLKCILKLFFELFVDQQLWLLWIISLKKGLVYFSSNESNCDRNPPVIGHQQLTFYTCIHLLRKYCQWQCHVNLVCMALALASGLASKLSNCTNKLEWPKPL